MPPKTVLTAQRRQGSNVVWQRLLRWPQTVAHVLLGALVIDGWRELEQQARGVATALTDAAVVVTYLTEPTSDPRHPPRGGEGALWSWAAKVVSTWWTFGAG